MLIRRYIMNQIQRNLFKPDLVHNILIDFDSCLNAAVKDIQAGKVIAIPTDTIYGLAVDAQNIEAIRKLYEIKDRASSKALAICIHSVQFMKQWGKIEHLSDKMLNELLPGPVTVVVDRTSNLNNKLNPGEDKIAIRIPKYNFVQNLTAALEKPIALTSANKSGNVSSVVIEEFSVLWPLLDAVFDGGTTGFARDGSTIVDLSENGKYKILREGGYLDSTLLILHKYGLKNL